MVKANRMSSLAAVFASEVKKLLGGGERKGMIFPKPEGGGKGRFTRSKKWGRNKVNKSTHLEANGRKGKLHGRNVSPQFLP